MKVKTIWIDLDNSPHILFFDPIIKELERRGHHVVITVRDYAQAIGLANLFKLNYQPLGKHYGKNSLMKVIGLVIRAFQMLPVYFKHKPDVAFSHGSRSQLLFSRLIGLSNIIAIDYEFVKFFPLLKSSLGIVPEVLPEQFGKKYFKKTVTYPGIKEDVYVSRFDVDPDFLHKINVSSDSILVTVRPPATSAHYHNPKSDEHFKKTMLYLCQTDNIKVLLLPRTKDQAQSIREEYAQYFEEQKMFIPDQVLNGLNLVWYSDLVISGGGTMIREATALGVPAYSIFGGQTGAVDRFLEESGRLKLIREESDIHDITVEKRIKPHSPSEKDTGAMNIIVDHVENLIN